VQGTPSLRTLTPEDPKPIAQLQVEAAIRRAREMVAAGVDIIDVGGQSTRPHAARLPPEVELQRIMPVIS
jgi:dihydropteroate synthase